VLAAAGWAPPPPILTPRIEITSPADGAVLTSKRIGITGTVTPNGSGIDHMTLNGTTVAPVPNPTPAGSYPFNFPVTLKKGANAFTLQVVDRDQTSAEAMLAVTYRTPRCSVRFHDVGARSELDVKCTKAIVNGSFSFLVNRSGCDRGCEPSVKIAGSGHLSCSGRGLMRGRQPYENLTCEGNLAAGSKARVFQRFETFSIPCDTPRFKGTFGVNFGDGTHLKSRKLPAYYCPARTHKRFFGLFHAGLSSPGGPAFVAELDIADGYQRCIKRVPVLVQVRSGGGWRTVFRGRTPNSPAPLSHGVWRVTVFGVAGGGGPYRALAPKIRFGNQTCAAATATG
jgi:hypothetical protein